MTLPLSSWLWQMSQEKTRDASAGSKTRDSAVLPYQVVTLSREIERQNTSPAAGLIRPALDDARTVPRFAGDTGAPDRQLRPRLVVSSCTTGSPRASSAPSRKTGTRSSAPESMKVSESSTSRYRGSPLSVFRVIAGSDRLQPNPKAPFPAAESYETESCGPKPERPGDVAMGTVMEPVPVTGFAVNFSPSPRIAPPPLGIEIDGARNGFRHSSGAAAPFAVLLPGSPSPSSIPGSVQTAGASPVPGEVVTDVVAQLDSATARPAGSDTDVTAGSERDNKLGTWSLPRALFPLEGTERDCSYGARCSWPITRIVSTNWQADRRDAWPISAGATCASPLADRCLLGHPPGSQESDRPKRRSGSAESF